MSTEERIAALQREVARCKRRFGWVVVLGVLGAGLTAWWSFAERRQSAYAAEKGKPEEAKGVVRGTAFVLVDEKGRIRAKLATTKVWGPYLVFYGAKGNTRVSLMTAPLNGLTLSDGAGNVSAMLHEGGAAGTRLLLEHAKGASVCLTANAAGRLNVTSEKGKASVSLTADTTSSDLDLFDADGKHRVALMASKKKMLLNMKDPNGSARAFLTTDDQTTELDLVHPKSKGSVVLTAGNERTAVNVRDAKGMARATLGTCTTKTADGKVVNYPESTLTLFGADGNVIWKAP